jgi:FkbM family methyltransferase
MAVSSSRLWRRVKGRFWSGVLGLAWRDVRIRSAGLRTLFGTHFAPGTLALVPFPDHQLFVDPRDDKIGLRLLHGRTWHRPVLEQSVSRLEAAGALATGGTFVDVGANIGAMTVYALLTGKFAHAIAIEPDPHNFAILARNIAVNNLTARVTLIQAAASTVSGTVTLQRDQRNLGAHTIHAKAVPTPDATTVTVRAAPLDALLAEVAGGLPAPSLVKIDVEGHELVVMESMPGLRAARVPLMFEYLADVHGAAGLVHLRTLLSGYAVVARADEPNDPGAAPSVFDPGAGEADLLAYRPA